MNTPMRKCREAEGIPSLMALSKECGVAGATLGRLEKGSYPGASGESCLKVLNRFSSYGLTLDQLLHPEKYPDFTISK